MVRRNEVIGRDRIDATIGLSQGFIKHHEDAAPSEVVLIMLSWQSLKTLQSSRTSERLSPNS